VSAAPALVFIEPHIWVNDYETCDYCNFQLHVCGGCGEDLDHEGFEVGGTKHAPKCPTLN
jgi:hypothetical protein